MKEHPILFNAEMVRAILDGLKTETRRPITPSNSFFDGGPWPKHASIERDAAWIDAGPSPAGNPGPYLRIPSWDGETTHRVYPRWRPGDRLWVRETWWHNESIPGVDGVAYRAGGEMPEHMVGDPWRPSIHMPRWASRITLEITGVRPERVQEIGRDGRKGEHVQAEGLRPERWAHYSPWLHPDDCPAFAFAALLWDGIYGKKPGLAWADNPWVWVTEVTVLTGEESKP